MRKAYVLVNTQIGEARMVRDRMLTIEGVTQAECVYGVYDVVIMVEHENNDKLKQIITEKVRQVDGVRSTLTMILTSP